MTTIALHPYQHLTPTGDTIASTSLPATFGHALLQYIIAQTALSNRGDMPTQIGYVMESGIDGAQTTQDETDLIAIRQSLREINDDPSVIVSGDELRNRLNRFLD